MYEENVETMKVRERSCEFSLWVRMEEGGEEGGFVTSTMARGTKDGDRTWAGWLAGGILGNAEV